MTCTTHLAHLAPREQQIAALVQLGKRNKEIAHTLGLTEGTIKQRMTRLFVRFGVTNRTEFARLCWERDREHKC